jgi:diguanylate cyclase (GGDEF)-like protein
MRVAGVLLAIAVVFAASGIGQAAAPGRARALVDEGTRLEAAGQLDAAALRYAEARAEAERTGERQVLADALTVSGYLHYARGEMNAALVDLGRAYGLYGDLRNEEGRRTALSYIAHVNSDPTVGQYDRAIEYYQQLLTQYTAAGAKTSVADVLFDIASTYERKGDFASALDWYRKASATEQSLGRLGEAMYVQRSIGITLGKLGRGDEALPLLDEALRFFESSKDVDRVAQVRQSRGIIHRRLGRYEVAIADLEASRAYFQGIKNDRFLEKSEDELALAYAGVGRWEEAYRLRTADAVLQQQLADRLREEHTSRLRVQFDTEKKEQENRALLRQSAADARIRNLQTAVLILGAAIILVLAYLAYRLVRDKRRLRAMALTDELTRLPNRRHLFALAEGELERSRRLGLPLSVAALDIDHFKRVNDRFGHAAGDAVLQRVASACRLALRTNDVLGRIGGEEFLALLPATSTQEGFAVAERLRAAVEAIDLSDLEAGLRATISIGIAEYQGSEETVARLSARADELLYVAKQNGRNRVVSAAA